jgi:S-adenosyl-l-methionine hydroxide adenosyltransferase
MARAVISLTTDFGIVDHFVGTMKGVILSILPEAAITDISHAIEAFDILGLAAPAGPFSHALTSSFSLRRITACSQ